MRWSGLSRSRLEAALVVAALLAVAVIGVTVPAPAAAAASLPPLSTGVVENITLYGSVTPPAAGWGYAANNTTTPGPHLTVGYGDTVQLTLFAADGATHNWFIDYDNNSQPDGAEPTSPDFSTSNAKVWNFTADRVGTFVYRCQYHPTTMVGLITISAPTRYTLYGSVLPPHIGWAFNTTATTPGPTLIIEAGANVTLTLYSADGIPHTFFIDYDNSSGVSAGEAESVQFGGSGNPNPYNYSFVAMRTGTFLYRCGIHPTSMWGLIVIVGKGSGAGGAAFPIGLIPGIMLAVIIGMLFLAVVYQIRASRAARLKK